MKKLSLLLLIILIVGCQGKSEVEIIPDYEAIYLPPSKVDVPVEILGDEDNQLKDIEEMIGKHFTPSNEAYYFFRAKLYIDENGKLDKIQFSKENPNKDFKDSDINPMIEELFPKLAEYLENVKFSSALLGDKKVKSQFVWEGSFKTNSKGKAEFYLGSLRLGGLKKNVDINAAEYSEQVDEMPSPIGGIKAIQEKIVYPETAKKEGIEGRVYIKAFINENGDVVSAEVIKGIGGGCDQEAINAVVNTKFKPARQNGKLVKVQVSIPILFKLH